MRSEPGRAGGRSGESHHAAKLTIDQVREIRRLCDGGAVVLPIAIEFGVSPNVIDRIARRDGWRHVPEDNDEPWAKPTGGRTRRGETHPGVKLTESQVREIRRLYDGDHGITLAQIAAQYGISKTLVFLVGRRRLWAHLPEEEVA